MTENPAEDINGVLDRIVNGDIPVDAMPDKFKYIREQMKKVPAAEREGLERKYEETIERVTKRFKAYCEAGWDAILDDDE